MHINLECPDLPQKSHLSELDCELEDDALFLDLSQTYHGDVDGIFKKWLKCLSFPKTSQSLL